MMKFRFILAASLALTMTTPVLAAELKVGVYTPTVSIDPELTTQSQTGGYNAIFYDTIVRLSDKDSSPEPWLATSWKIVNDTTWEFILRDGVKFHDGSIMTAEDAAFSIMRAKTLNGNPLSFGNLMGQIKDAQAVDARTLRVTTNIPSPTLLDTLGLTYVVSKKVAQNAKTEDFNSGKAAIGTGPYKFVAFRQNDVTVGERFPDYWGGAASWDRITLTVMANPSSRVAAVLAGDVDVAEEIPDQDIERVKATPNMTVVNKVTNRNVYLAIDVGKEALETGHITGPNDEKLDQNPLADARIREAMKLAINLDAFVARIYGGQAASNGQYYPTGSFSAVPGVDSWKPDEAKARALVQQSGWAGKFKIKLTVPGDFFPKGTDSAQGLAQSLTRVGIPTTVNNIAYSLYADQRAQRKLSVLLGAIGSQAQKTELSLVGLFHTRKGGLGSINFVGYSNPEVDKLLERSFSTMDEAEQLQTRRDAQKILLGENQIVPLWFLGNNTAVRAELEFTPRVTGVMMPTNIKPKK